jgi:hypothetical protein
MQTNHAYPAYPDEAQAHSTHMSCAVPVPMNVIPL